ncbi:DUF397 domain-containing protein [Streptomyces sp. TR06-5]|uniref:DUF397 domain-containing protein n=1 Tax=unclassified Streptomyces TaxID=2593676 RepID=UPI00399F405D
MTLQHGRTSDWIRSSYSTGNGACVEVASPARDVVGVRDSKVPDGPRLRFRPRAWRGFVATVRGS